MIQTQELTDQKLLSLVETMKNTFSFAKNLKELSNREDFGILKEIINKILQQTAECAFFIREYASRRFLRKYPMNTQYLYF